MYCALLTTPESLTFICTADYTAWYYRIPRSVSPNQKPQLIIWRTHYLISAISASKVTLIVQDTQTTVDV